MSAIGDIKELGRLSEGVQVRCYGTLAKTRKRRPHGVVFDRMTGCSGPSAARLAAEPEYSRADGMASKTSDT